MIFRESFGILGDPCAPSFRKVNSKNVTRSGMLLGFDLAVVEFLNSMCADTDVATLLFYCGD